MTKIFIDTNVFLDMYRSNIQSDIKTLMQFIYQNKKHFITTEQSINEFTRNRYTILNEALNNFTKQTSIDKSSSTFLRSLHGYKKYEESLKRFWEQRNIILDELQEKIDFPEKDEIYSKFKKLCKSNNIIGSSINIIDAASRRKVSRNPLTSNKYTCGDEIIWEALLTYISEHGEDLIIVSKDKTFSDNKEFLSEEFANKAGGSLTLSCQNMLSSTMLFFVKWIFSTTVLYITLFRGLVQ